MSYPINQAITYSALATTPGRPSDTFTYNWVFDDSSIGSGSSLSHTWTTPGPHLATVTAADDQAGTSATTSKTITTADWSAMTWTSTSALFIPTGSTSALGRIRPVIKSGNEILNVVDYYIPLAAVSYDTSLLTRRENLTALSPLSGASVASTGKMLTAGPHTGKILVTSRNGLDYGFLDVASLTVSMSPNTMASPIYDNGIAYGAFSIPIDSDRILFIASTSGSALTCQMYSQATDTFTAKATAGGPAANSLLSASLIGGRVWVVVNGDTATKYYDVANNTWNAGPTLVGGPFAAGDSLKLAYRGGYPFFVSVGNPGVACWWDGVSATLTTGANFPLAQLNGGVLSSTAHSISETASDGFLLMVGGLRESGVQVSYSHNIVADPYSGTLTKTCAAPAFGSIHRSCFHNGRFWVVGNNGVLYKS